MTRSTTFAKHPWLPATVLAASLLAACGGGGDDPEATSRAPATDATAAANKLDTLLAASAVIHWSNTPGGVSVAVDAADNVYTVSSTSGPGGDILLTKRSAAGALLWTRSFDNTDATRFEAAGWVATDSQGNAYVSGTVRSVASTPANLNGVLMKFAPDGSLMWRQVLGTEADGSSAHKLLVDAAGNVVLLGTGVSANLALVTSVQKFSPDGASMWRWDDTLAIGSPHNIKFGADGRILVAAIRPGFGGYAALLANGSLILTGNSLATTSGMDLAGDAAGNTYLAHGGKLRKVPATFAEAPWERTLPLMAFHVEVDAQGAPLVSGTPGTATGGAAFIKHAADGTLLWSNMDADGAGADLLNHAQLKMGADNHAYLVGTQGSDMGVVKVAPDGSSVWTAVVPAGAGFGVELGSAGSVFAAGLSATASIGTAAPAPSADLGVTLSDAPDPVRVGADVVFTAVARNQGPSPASATVFNLALPSGLTLRSATPTQGSCTGSTTIRCTLGALPSGSQATVTVRVRAATRGSKTTTANVAAAEADPSIANNSATVITTVNRR